MLKYLWYMPLVMLLLLWSSCRKELEFASSDGNLTFSKDTVYLDTVFTTIGSSTYTLKVYNRNRDDLEIPSIRLGQGLQSNYRLNVDGVAGKEFRNIPIFAEDSLYIFIETTFDIAPTQENTFLYTDVIQFDSGIHQQDVQLVTLVKDAVFLYPNTLPDGSKETIALGTDPNGEQIESEGFYLSDQHLVFTNDKPYVIYGYAAVESGKTLTINAGSRVHFHQDSGLYIDDNATLLVNGALSIDQELLENEVVFEGDRLEDVYSDIPGQWGSIWLSEGSGGHSIDYLSINNATVALFIEGDGILQSPTLTIKNTQIHNSSSTNLWAKSAAIMAENLVLGAAGKTSLHCNLGGDYTFMHCTIANYWKHGFRTGTALQIDNFSTLISGTSINMDLVKADFLNCIIDGNSAIELSLRNNGTNSFDFNFDHSLIKFDDAAGLFNANPDYDFQNTDLYNAILLNQNVDFLDSSNHDYSLNSSSEAIDKANVGHALLVPLDILGQSRTNLPDFGAYEFTAQN